MEKMEFMDRIKHGFGVISNILVCAVILSLLVRLYLTRELSTAPDILIVALCIARCGKLISCWFIKRKVSNRDARETSR